MIKYTFKLITALFLLVSSSAIAGLIDTELTKDDYITYQGIDWAWASPVNVTPYYSNILKAPEYHAGWRYATDIELNILRSEITLDYFTRVDSSGLSYYVEAFEYWNTELTGINIDIDDFNNKKINSMLTVDIQTEWDYETFYVRNAILPSAVRNSIVPSAVRNSIAPAVAQVPEPTTLFIFAAGLLGFTLRKRNAK
jgi:hypothetical protein